MKHLKILLLVAIIFNLKSVSAQIIDVDYNFNNSDGIKQKEVGTLPTRSTSDVPQILNSGLVNYLTNGNVQAAANLLRINVGDPKGFYMPFYIYTGTSGGGFGNAQPSASSIGNLLNPIGGTINLSFNGLQVITKGNGYTYLKLTYQIGGRLNNGKDSVSGQNYTFYNGVANAGLYFQTQAWVDGDAKNMGMFFIMIKAIGTFSAKDNYQRILGDHSLTDNYLIGYSIDAGLEISKVIDAKLGLYQFTNDNISAVLNKPVLSFTLNYLLGK